MTKKDFIALADALRGLEVSEEVLQVLCNFMRAENATFMEGRWRAYLAGECGPNGGKVKA